MTTRQVTTPIALALSIALLAGCADEQQGRIPLSPEAPFLAGSVGNASAATVRQLAAQRGIVALPPPPFARPALVRLGQVLIFDKILSGNRDISCATCHLPHLATGDAKSLSVGQAGVGLGAGRFHPAGTFIPRNAPPLFNLAAMRHLFWDGRVQLVNDSLVTPAGAQLTPAMTRAFEFGAISALAMFPVTNRGEMRADSANELGEVPDSNSTEIWRRLMARLGAIPEYRALFEEAYLGRRFDELTFAHASNAIAAFLIGALSTANTPWDQFLAGNDQALTPLQLNGATTFLTLRCSICHNGSTFSDEQFHNVAVAQIGPGVGNGASGRDDFGRMNATGRTQDRYLFRTTPLRNVELTAPYGHDGALTTLRGFIDHYSESDVKLRTFDPTPLEPALRGTVVPNAGDILARRDTLLNGVVFDDTILNALMHFMSALTDPAARHLKRIAPPRVPSGIPLGIVP